MHHKSSKAYYFDCDYIEYLLIQKVLNTNTNLKIQINN